MATVLIVDDDKALRRAVAVALGDLGHHPAEAGDGEAALAWLSRQQADAVLLDLRMPGMDGMDVLRLVRSKPNPPPVAVLTAVPSSENTIEAMRLGAIDHLAKPIGRDELKRLLQRMLPTDGASLPPAALSRIAKEGDLVGASGAMREVQSRLGCWPIVTPPCCFSAKPAQAKRSLLVRSTSMGAAPAHRSCR